VRPRGLVRDRHVLAHERLAALGGARLGGLAQRGADAAPLARGRDCDQRGAAVVEQRVPDRSGAVLHQPRVARELDARGGPVGLHVLERVVGPPEVGDVARDDQLQDRGGVAGLRGADVHAGQITD
jgi:hypothetical protein